VTRVTFCNPVKPTANPAEPHLVETLAARCPSCNAALRSDAQWCSLCHHDLRPAPEPVAHVPAPAEAGYGGQDPLTAPLLDLVLPPVPRTEPEAVLPAVPAPAAVPAELSWPCTACGAHNALASTVCGSCGSRFLQGASEAPSLVVPGVGDLQHLSRGHRAAVAAAFVALLVIPLALLTFFLTGEPPKDSPSPGGDGTVTTIVTQ
jgi:hypothetical protein